MYADDIKIYGIYDDNSKAAVHQALTASISRMMDWAVVNGIPVNLTKTTVMHIGHGPSNLYTFNGDPLSSTSEVRDLGVYLKSDLKFDAHIDMIVKKAFATLFVIFRNIHCSDASVYLKLYKAYVIPILEYGSQLWSPFSKKLQVKLERVQKVFTRVVLCRCFPDSEYRSSMPSYQKRLDLLNMKSLLYRRVVNDLIFCFKILRNETKLRVSKYWSFRPCHGRTKRLGLHCVPVKKRHHLLVSNSFFFRCARWIEMLPFSILDAPSASAFRGRLMNVHLLSTLNIADF
ncbi:hypothetical protein V3C99_011027 [Haemonchus contortus]